MRVGIVILPDRRWGSGGDRWRRAEQYGFAHAWTYDHLSWRELAAGPWFDAVPTLAAAAGVTSTMRLGTLVASPNFRHPVHFAREVISLDDLSAGRLLVGLGAGGTGFDASVLGQATLTPRQRADRFEEFVTLLDQLLRTDRLSWSGTYYSAVDARSTPGCVQRPRAPFVVAGNGPRSLALAARFGQGWVTTGTLTDPLADSLAGWWREVAGLASRFGDLPGASSVDRYLLVDSHSYALHSVAAFADAAGRAAELGFTDVITHWPRESSWYQGSEDVLEAVAADILPTL